MGYSKPHVGYKCLHIPTGRVTCVSRHVVFNEDRFPFLQLLFLLLFNIRPLLCTLPPCGWIPLASVPQVSTLQLPHSRAAQANIPQITQATSPPNHHPASQVSSAPLESIVQAPNSHDFESPTTSPASLSLSPSNSCSSVSPNCLQFLQFALTKW